MRPDGFTTRREREIRKCVENVRAGSGTRRIQFCPICSSKDRELRFSRFGIDIMQCLECTVGYSSEFPVDLDDVYNADEYLPIAKADYLTNVSYRKSRFGRERIDLIGHFLNKPPEKASLLDIGCGTGWFLECAKEAGYAVTGQELSQDLAKLTQDRTGQNILSLPITDIPYEPQYDVISMFDVLEHLPNPAEVLTHIHRLIKSDGMLLFFVPNLDSLGFKLLKADSSLCMPVEHLFYFTEKSLTLMLKQVGFEVELLESKGMDVADLAAYYRDVPQNAEVATFLSELANLLQPIVDEAGCGNHLRVVCRKPPDETETMNDSYQTNE